MYIPQSVHPINSKHMLTVFSMYLQPKGDFPLQPDPECPVTEWSEWSPCSVRCGPGVRLRSRILLSEPHLNATCAARRQLQQQHPCTGRQDCVIDMNTAKGE